MATKLEAARLGMGAGVAVVIASGEQAGIIPGVVRGEAYGTRFLAGPRPEGDPLEPWLAEVAR
jgi:glutamate 5-kinase